MPVEVIMPKLGLTMTEGTIRHWFKSEGDKVDKDEPLFEFETDKAVMEVKAPQRGVLGNILAPVGATVPVAQVVAIVLPEGEEIGEGAAERPTPPSAPPTPTTRIKASPRAKKLAKELGIDLTGVVGSGPGERIVGEDVERYATALAERAAPAPPVTPVAPPAVGVGEVIPLTGVRATIAQRMAESAHTTAGVTLTTEADATELTRLRTQLREEMEASLDLSLSYNEMLVKIVAAALREHPNVNATLTEDGIQLLQSINIGVAVDTERGLLIPVIRDADDKDLVQIVRDFRDSLERARAGQSLPDDLSGGTFTITNLGMHEIDAFTPIIKLPECAILGVGRIVAKPVVYEDEICVRQMMYLSLTFDHRLVDGAPAARFLQRVKQLIEKPYLILV